MHSYFENESAVKGDKVVLNDLPGDIYTTEANEKIAGNCKYPLVIITQAPQNHKQTNTEGLAKLLKLKAGAKVMFRGSHRKCSLRKRILRNFAKYTGKYLCRSLIFKKFTGLTFFTEPVWVITCNVNS